MFTGTGTAPRNAISRRRLARRNRLRSLVKRQIDAGINFLVPCGTTGESPTLTHTEHLRVVEITLEIAKGKCPSSPERVATTPPKSFLSPKSCRNSAPTASFPSLPITTSPRRKASSSTLKLSRRVSTYPSFSTAFRGRTGVNIEPATVLRLSQIENIVGIKEASGSISQMGAILNLVSKDFLVPLRRRLLDASSDFSRRPRPDLRRSNEIPEEMTRLVQSALSGDFLRSPPSPLPVSFLDGHQLRRIQSIPVKAALADKWACSSPSGACRLVSPKPENLARIRAVLESLNLLERVHVARSN